MQSAEIASYLMLVVTVAYMVYFMIKIRLEEKREIAILDEEFLLEKKDRK